MVWAGTINCSIFYGTRKCWLAPGVECGVICDQCPGRQQCRFEILLKAFSLTLDLGSLEEMPALLLLFFQDQFEKVGENQPSHFRNLFTYLEGGLHESNLVGLNNKWRKKKACREKRGRWQKRAKKIFFSWGFSANKSLQCITYFLHHTLLQPWFLSPHTVR